MRIGERCFIIQVTELIVEVSILIISHLDDPIFYTEGVSKIYIERMMMDLHKPVINIPAVKKRHPLGIFTYLLLSMTTAEPSCCQ